MDAMKAKSAAGSPTQKKIALKAKEVGLKRAMALAASGGKDTGLTCLETLQYVLLKAIVFKKVRKTLCQHDQSVTSFVTSLAAQSSPSPPPHMAIFGSGLLDALWRSRPATQRALGG